MTYELIQVRTRDGVRLDGSLQRPSPAATPSDAAPLPFDAVLCIHGTGGNFYTSTVFDALAPKFLLDGIPVLRVNTRGHDTVAYVPTTSGPVMQGAACEIVSDCLHDLAAWIQLLCERGFRRVVLVGHSLGALKAVYAVAHERPPAVCGVVAISPPRLSHSFFAASERGAEFLHTLETAQRLVADGAGDTLIPVTIPLAHVFSAASYVEKYGLAEPYNLLNFVGRLNCPTLFTFGGDEVQREVAFRDLPAALAAAAGDLPAMQVVAIAGANHVYLGQHELLAHRVRHWLRGLC